MPASECPNAHARVQRVLLRMNGRMRKAAEARTKRVLSAGMRSMNAEGMEGLGNRRFDPLDAGAFTFLLQ